MSDIPKDVFDAAEAVLAQIAQERVAIDGDSEVTIGGVDLIANAILAAKAEVEAERDLLQEIIDGRPAINAALPDSYIRWSQSIYSGEAVRAAIGKRGVN